jgi:hypothetical protein
MVPESGKLGTAPRLYRLWQHLHRHRLLLYVCLDYVTDFIFAYSVLAKPKYAFITDMPLVPAKLGPHLVLDGSDCIVSGIDIHLRWLPRCVSVILPTHYAPWASCAATSTSKLHNIPSHGYLDQGCCTHRSRLPRYRHKGYHLAWALLGFLYSPSIREATPSTMLPLQLCVCGGGGGGHYVSPLVYTPSDSLQSDHPWHYSFLCHYLYDCGRVLEIY